MSQTTSNVRRRRLVVLRQAMSSSPPQRQHPACDDLGCCAEAEQVSPTQVFRDACGVDRSLELTVAKRDGGDEPVVFSRELPFVVLGRGSRCDIRLPHPEVSHRHAYLQKVGASVFCYDLASQNGILWNSSRRRSGTLAQNDELGIGPYVVSLSLHAESDGDSIGFTRPDEASAEAPPEPLLFEFLKGTRRAAVWRPSHPVTLVGQSPICKVRLSHDSVSRVHCSIVQTGSGLWIVDLLGRVGTLLNGEKVGYAPLRAGDEVRIGRFHFRVVPCAEVVAKQIAAKASQRSGPIARTAMNSRETQASQATLARTPEPSTIESRSDGDLTPAATSELVMALVREFRSAQERTVEQSHHAMLTLLQMFCQAQESQTSVLREIQTELAGIQRLSSQLESVQSDLTLLRAEIRSHVPGTAPNETQLTPPDPHRVSLETFATADSSAASELQMGSSQPRSDAWERDDANVGNSDNPSPRTEDCELPAHGDPESAACDLGEADDASEAELQEQANRVHSELCQRLVRIENERTTRWRKLICSLTGLPERAESDYHTSPPAN